MDETGSFWTDPDAVVANAAGRVTPAQYELVAGRRARGAPVVAGVLIALAGLVVPSVRWLYDYAWFVGFFVSGGLYYALMRMQPQAIGADAMEQ